MPNPDAGRQQFELRNMHLVALADRALRAGARQRAAAPTTAPISLQTAPISRSIP